MNVNTIQRVFKYGDINLEDFNSNLSPEEIKLHFSGSYPELTNAQIQNKGIQADSSILYEFKVVVGTKG